MPLAAKKDYRESMTNNGQGRASDPAPDEPLVAAFSSSSFEGEMEAMTILGVLQSNGIPAIYVGPHMLPSMEFQVQVPQHMLDAARQAIAKAQADGADVSDEAEARPDEQ